MRIYAFLTTVLLTVCLSTFAQSDTATHTLKDLSPTYFTQLESKIDTYSKRIIGKTEKTLTKLSRWENKIKSLLVKASPATAERLFAPGTLTFASALQNYKAGESIATNIKGRYDGYRDNVTTGLKFMEKQNDNLDSNVHKKIAEATAKNEKLNAVVVESESIEKFIAERKKLLIDQSLKHIGKSKYLQKINKEGFYYVETLRNYKQIFNDQKRAEETAVALLNKIPAFKKFFQNNSMLASLFRTPDNYGTPQALAGLQTRASVNSLIQNRIATGGPGARETISQNMQAAQAEINKLKDKIIKAGGTNSNAEMHDFKANMQKTQTFKQRLEFGSNLQFGKAQNFIPANANIGIQAGYKLNDRSTIGLGASYRVGIGKIEKIRLTHEGLGLRSFIDWKLNKQFFASGGYEQNYISLFNSISQLGNTKAWQNSGLLGISKKYKVSNKVAGSMQLLWDFLSYNHTPRPQPVLFRFGYNLSKN